MRVAYALMQVGAGLCMLGKLPGACVREDSEARWGSAVCRRQAVRRLSQVSAMSCVAQDLAEVM